MGVPASTMILSTMKYDNTQFGWFLIVIFGIFIIWLPLAFIFQWGNHPISLIPCILMTAFLLFILSLFYKLRIKVDKGLLHIIYGIGLIHIRIKPEEVIKVSKVKNPWYYGLGIRIIPGGTLYNITGLKAVEMVYKKGRNKMVRLGCADCELLKKAIEDNFMKNNQSDEPM